MSSSQSTGSAGPCRAGQGHGGQIAGPGPDKQTAGGQNHPLTGQRFSSPVPPGSGWPADPAAPDTPIARSAGAAARLADTSCDLPTLQARASVCRACPRLVAWREQVAHRKRAAYADQPYWGRPVPSLGDPRAGLLIVGLAPAAHGGNRTGRLFTGDRSGDWLFAALHRVGLAALPTATAAGDGQRLTGVRLTAPVRCAPPQNKPTATELHTCSAWFDRELMLLTEMRGILALGGIAWRAVLGAARRLGWQVPRPLPRFGHLASTELVRAPGRVVRMVGCYHVSQQNTFTGRLTGPMLDEAIRLAAGGRCRHGDLDSD